MKKLLQNKNQKEIIIKALVSLILRASGYGFGFIFIWLIAQKLGAGVQGIFAIAFLFLSVGSMIGKFGISTAVIKWVANETEKEKQRAIIQKSLITVLFSSLVIGTIIFFSAQLIASWYQKPSIVESIRIAALTIPIFSLIEVGSSVFKGTKDIPIFSTYFDFLKFLFPSAVFAALYFMIDIKVEELPIWSYLIGHFLLLTIVLIHLQIRFSLIKFNLITQKTFSVKQMLTESYPMLMASSIVMIMGWSDVFLLGFFVNEDDIGVYSTAVRIATLVSFTYAAIAAIMTPKISSFYHHKQENDYKATIIFSSRLMFFCGLPIFLILFTFSEFFLSIFGETYKEGVTVLRILLVAQLGNVVTGPVGPIFQMTGKQKLLQNFLLISLFINVIFSLILVFFYQEEGVAIGSALGMIGWNLMGAKYLKSKCNLVTWVNFKK